MIGSCIATCTWEEAQQGHAAVVERCKAGSKEISSAVSKAQELAQRTVKKASHMAISSLIERSFKTNCH